MPKDKIEIDIAVLENATSKLYAHIREKCGDKIELDEDYYWSFSAPEKYDVSKDYRASEIGQLSDDWATIKRISEGTDEPISYALVWLGELLKYVGEKEVS